MNGSPVASSYSCLAGPPNRKMRCKTKKGNVMISNRRKAKRVDIESNSNSNILVEPPILNGIRPVQDRNFTRNKNKYLEQPETCSYPAPFPDFSLKAGFTFLILAISSMLIPCLSWTGPVSRKECKIKCFYSYFLFAFPVSRSTLCNQLLEVISSHPNFLKKR